MRTKIPGKDKDKLSRKDKGGRALTEKEIIDNEFVSGHIQARSAKIFK